MHVRNRRNIYATIEIHLNAKVESKFAFWSRVEGISLMVERKWSRVEGNWKMVEKHFYGEGQFPEKW